MPRISQAKLDREVRTALRNSGLDEHARACTVGLWSAEDEARAAERDYAWVIPEELEFGFSRKTLVLDDDHRRAVIAHEVGHVLAWHHWQDTSEDGADHAAEQFLGVPICYDHDWPGKGLQVDCRIGNGGRVKNPAKYRWIVVDSHEVRDPHAKRKLHYWTLERSDGRTVKVYGWTGIYTTSPRKGESWVEIEGPPAYREDREIEQAILQYGSTTGRSNPMDHLTRNSIVRLRGSRTGRAGYGTVRDVLPDGRVLVQWHGGGDPVWTRREDLEIVHSGSRNPKRGRTMKRTNPRPKFHVVIYEEIVEWVDPEDPDGYETETREMVDDDDATLEDVINYAKRYGIEPRGRNDLTTWWESSPNSEFDFSRNVSRQYTMHVKRNGKQLDASTFERINKLLGGRRNPKNPRNPYQGDAVELAKYRKARERWEKGGRRGPPPVKPRSRNPLPKKRQANPLPVDARAATMARRIGNP